MQYADNRSAHVEPLRAEQQKRQDDRVPASGGLAYWASPQTLHTEGTGTLYVDIMSVRDQVSEYVTSVWFI
jgi:hypothetical protein